MGVWWREGTGGGYGERVSDCETGRPVGAVAPAAPLMERRMRGSEAAMATEAVMRWRGGARGQYHINDITTRL